jgi:hypothetical protein
MEALFFGYINKKFELGGFREYLFSLRMNAILKALRAASSRWQEAGLG